MISVQTPSNPSSALLQVKPFMHNPLGFLHGGALAVSCDEFLAPGTQARKIKSMEIKYLTSMNGQISLLTEREEQREGVSLPTSSGASISGRVESSKKNLCAQFRAHYF